MGTITLQIPQTSLPNATEDPKITSSLNTLQAWANGGIDYVNLSSALQALIPSAVFTSYTPTWNNGVIGNGTLAGHYMLQGKVCYLNIYLSVGSTTTATATASTFSLPASAAAGFQQSIGGLSLADPANPTLLTATAGLFPSGSSVIAPYTFTGAGFEPLTTAQIDTSVGGVPIYKAGGWLIWNGFYITS